MASAVLPVIATVLPNAMFCIRLDLSGSWDPALMSLTYDGSTAGKDQTLHGGESLWAVSQADALLAALYVVGLPLGLTPVATTVFR